MSADGFWLSSTMEAQRRLYSIGYTQAGLEDALRHPEDHDHTQRVNDLVRDIDIALSGDEMALDELEAYREDRLRHSVKLAKAYKEAREAGRSALDVDLRTATLRPKAEAAVRSALDEADAAQPPWMAGYLAEREAEEDEARSAYWAVQSTESAADADESGL